MSKSHHLGPRFFLPSNPLRLKPILSYSSAPTHEEVSNLILQQKSASQALATFRWAARLPSFVHHPSTYHALVRSLLSFRRLDAAFEALHEIPSATGSQPDEATLVALLRALGRARRPRDALHLLDLLPSRFGVSKPSLRIFNSVLDVLVREDIDTARDFFRERMMGRGIRGDEHTFGILMKGLSRTNRIAEGFKLLQLMKRSGLRPNAVTYNTLIHALCRNGKVGRARSLMNEMESPSGVTFNILISAYCGEGNVVQALVMLEKCFQLGLVPDAINATKIVGVLCSQGRVMEAAEILERVERKGGVRDVVSYNTLIKGFCGMNKPEVGRRVLKEMECKGCLPNVHTYNALISGFCGSGKLDSAMDLFREMRTDGIHPDFETFDVLIRGLCSGGRVGDGLKVLDEMEEERAVHGIQINPYNSILYGLYKEDRVEEAYEFLKNMSTSFPRAVDRSLAILWFCKEDEVGEGKLVYDQMVGEGGVPNVLVYACLIKGLCKEGNVRGAFLLMNDMVEKGFFPVAATFNALICAFCEEGNLSSASKLLQEMVRRGCNLDAGSYSPLISALCKQGDLTRAFGYLVQMVERDIAPDHSTWNSLLLCDSLWTKSGSKIAMNESLMQVVEV